MYAISSDHGNRPTHTHTHTHIHTHNGIWYGILEFNVPLDTIYVISETGLPTHKQTGPITIHCAAASAQCNRNRWTAAQT